MLLRYCRTMTMYDATISLPASFLVAGPRGSGKSYWVKDLLLSEILSPSPPKNTICLRLETRRHF
jgi:hypothetical protein